MRFLQSAGILLVAPRRVRPVPPRLSAGHVYLLRRRDGAHYYSGCFVNNNRPLLLKVIRKLLFGHHLRGNRLMLYTREMVE